MAGNQLSLVSLKIRQNFYMYERLEFKEAEGAKFHEFKRF